MTTILDTPQYRALVQENRIVAEFQDALFPKLIFRSECEDEEWGEQQGDSKIFTGEGIMPVTTAPVAPLSDAPVASYGREQWMATINRYGKSLDSHAPTSAAAAVKTILRDVKKLGENAGQTLNRICRDKLMNAGLSGHTVADGAQGPTTTIRVKRLNGFTRARRPDLPAGAAVRFEPVSANNPLPIKYGNALASSTTVVGYTADFPGDEIGPGTITTSGAITVADRDAIVADTATWIRRSGGGNRVDDLGNTDVLTLADLRAVLSRLSNMDVPRHGDGYYHGHLDPTSNNQIFGDNEWQRLNETLPEGFAYTNFALGRRLGCIWLDNNQCPQIENVNLPNGSTDGATGDNYNPALEAYAGDFYPNGTPTNAAGKVHHVIVTGGGGLKEYYVDQDAYMTAAGVAGKISDMPQDKTGDVTIVVERVKLIQQAPKDRFAENVPQTWKFVGDHVFRTDAATGDGRYYKRVGLVQHIEP